MNVDTGNNNNNNSQKPRTGVFPPEIILKIAEHSLPREYIKLYKTLDNPYFKGLAKSVDQLLMMAKFWLASKDPKIGKFIKKWCEEMISYEKQLDMEKRVGPSNKLGSKLFEDLVKAILLDDLFHKLALIIFEDDNSEESKLERFEIEFMNDDEALFLMEKLEYWSDLEKLIALNIFFKLNKVSDWKFISLAIELINNQKDIKKYKLIYSHFLNKIENLSKIKGLSAKCKKRILAKGPQGSLYSNIMRCALIGVANPDLDNKRGIDLREDLFIKVILKYEYEVEYQEEYQITGFDFRWDTVMSIPDHMCYLLLELADPKGIQFPSDILYQLFTLPRQRITVNSGSIIIKNVRDYRIINGFTEEKFTQLYDKFILEDIISEEDVHKYAIEIGLIDGNEFCYDCPDNNNNNNNNNNQPLNNN